MSSIPSFRRRGGALRASAATLLASRRRLRALAGAAALVVAAGAPSGAQESAAAFPATPAVPAAPAAPAASAARPFAVGERLTYDVKFGPLHVGTGSIAIVGRDAVRGHDPMHIVFTVHGGIPFYHVNDTMQSWMDPATLESLRFEQNLNEGRRHVRRHIELYPDSGTYVEVNKHRTHPTVPHPLDDASFLYFVRTQPLEVGRTYTYDNYFHPDANPVTIRVLRRERVTVPAGTFDAIVIQPIIKTSGMFGQGGRALIWLSDDATHAVLQLKSDLPIGSLNLYLKAYEPGEGGRPLTNH